MMLWHLIRKDYLIIKKYVLLMLVVVALIPPFMLWRVPVNYAGTMGFVYSIVFALLILQQYVSMKEAQYPKAATLFCAAPVPRSLFVLSKYCFCLLGYVICCLIFWMETIIFPALGEFSGKMAAEMLCMISVFFGIYFPAEYKIGYEKTRFAFLIVIFATAYAFPALLKISVGRNVQIWPSAPPLLFSGILTVVSVLILGISAVLSIRIYENKDLD